MPSAGLVGQGPQRQTEGHVKPADQYAVGVGECPHQPAGIVADVEVPPHL